MKFYERTRRLFPPIFIPFLNSCFHVSCSNWTEKETKLIIIMVSIELNLKIIDLCQKYLIEIHVFLKRKKKNADISFNKLLISEKCEYWIFHKFQLKVREPSCPWTRIMQFNNGTQVDNNSITQIVKGGGKQHRFHCDGVADRMEIHYQHRIHGR